MKLVYIKMLVLNENKRIGDKSQKLSSWIFENVPNENCSRLTEKTTKNRRLVFLAYDDPENHTRKEKKKNGNSDEIEKRRRKKAMAALLVFMFGSLKTAFETKKKNYLIEEIYFGCKVIA